MALLRRLIGSTTVTVDKAPVLVQEACGNASSITHEVASTKQIWRLILCIIRSTGVEEAQIEIWISITEFILLYPEILTR